MNLKILDQVHLSGVSPNTLTPGEVVAVSDALGQELLEKHPDKFEEVDEKHSPVARRDAGADVSVHLNRPGRKRETQPANKAEAAPKNQAQRPPRNKAGGAAKKK